MTETLKPIRFCPWRNTAPSESTDWTGHMDPAGVYQKIQQRSYRFLGSLPRQGTSQLAGSGVGRLPTPWDPPLPCWSSWLLGQPTSQRGSWAAEYPGKHSERWEAKEFGSWQIKRDIRGISFPWKVSSFWLFILIQEEIRTRVCVYVCLYTRKKR